LEEISNTLTNSTFGPWNGRASQIWGASRLLHKVPKICTHYVTREWAMLHVSVHAGTMCEDTVFEDPLTRAKARNMPGRFRQNAHAFVVCLAKPLTRDDSRRRESPAIWLFCASVMPPGITTATHSQVGCGDFCTRAAHAARLPTRPVITTGFGSGYSEFVYRHVAS
jgi:hypothetical protein